jgi:hypothetical protein
MSTINRLTLSLAFATPPQSWDRAASALPLIWGILSRNTPSAVLSVPSSSPLR